MRNLSKLMTLGVIAVVTAAGTQTARAETMVPLGPVGGQVWTAAGSPYMVRGDITVDAGTSLRIEEGTTVTVAVFGVAVAINVLGTLTAAGTAEHPVTFDGDGGMWAGIIVKGTANITGAVIRRGNTGVKVDDAAATATVTRSRFEMCQSAISAAAGQLSADAVDVNGCNSGVSSSGSGVARLVNALIRNNSYAGFNMNGGTITIINSTIHHNVSSSGATGYAIYATGGGGTFSATNCIFSSHRALASLRDATATIDSSVLWDLQTAPIGSAITMTNTVTADPLYVGAEDLHLMEGSPCIDKGTSINTPNHDFDFVIRPVGKNDIGAFEWAPKGIGTGGASGAAGASGAGGANGAGGSAGAGGLGGSTSGNGGGTSSGGAGSGGSSTGGMSPVDAGAGTGGGSGGSTSGTGGAPSTGGVGTGGKAGTGGNTATGGKAGAGGSAGKGGKATTNAEACGCRTAGGDGSGAAAALVALALVSLASVRRRRR